MLKYPYSQSIKEEISLSLEIFLFCYPCRILQWLCLFCDFFYHTILFYFGNKARDCIHAYVRPKFAMRFFTESIASSVTPLELKNANLHMRIPMCICLEDFYKIKMNDWGEIHFDCVFCRHDRRLCSVKLKSMCF